MVPNQTSKILETRSLIHLTSKAVNFKTLDFRITVSSNDTTCLQAVKLLDISVMLNILLHHGWCSQPLKIVNKEPNVNGRLCTLYSVLCHERRPCYSSRPYTQLELDYLSYIEAGSVQQLGSWRESRKCDNWTLETSLERAPAALQSCDVTSNPQLTAGT